ncbi:sensor histidine kinase [Silvimonas soli]|uniref:sensor histidine kinase n=1 Tax=Silvimonas soli TaxID=2980100 RepID=UPI0024B368F2|nr:sensor histidine kinase [Silvimonas soli]
MQAEPQPIATPWLIDSTATLTAKDAGRATTWNPPVTEVNHGFTAAAIWLGVNLDAAHGQTILELTNPILEDVRLYQLQSDGSWQEQRAGRAVAHKLWPLDTISVAFVLPPSTASTHFMLRIASRTSLSTRVQSWSAKAFYAHTAEEGFWHGVYFGVSFLVIALQLFFWWWTREAFMGWYGAYAATILLVVLLASGLPRHLAGSVAVPLGGFALCILPWVGAKLSSGMLDLRDCLPRYGRAMLYGLGAVASVAALLTLSGFYALGVSVAAIASLLWAITTQVAAFVLWQRGMRKALFYMVTFSIFDLGAAIRYLRNLGALSPSVLTDYSLQAGALIHMVMMSLYIIYRYNALRRALAIEQLAHQQQRDFVSMVSHEFRTPMAIINTSAQKLAANPDGPKERFLQRCTNIRNACLRMSNLIDEYLSLDRLEYAEQPMHHAWCSIQELLEEVAADFPYRRVHVITNALPARFFCDRQLLRVALGNLLSNANRYSPPDKGIELQAEGDDTGDVRIRVVDHGEGIAPDELPRIFQKYFRGRNASSKPGAGLGLFLVERIVQQHGGKLTVASPAGEGCSFSIWLPHTTDQP